MKLWKSFVKLGSGSKRKCSISVRHGLESSDQVPLPLERGEGRAYDALYVLFCEGGVKVNFKYSIAMFITETALTLPPNKEILFDLRPSPNPSQRERKIALRAKMATQEFETYSELLSWSRSDKQLKASDMK